MRWILPAVAAGLVLFAASANADGKRWYVGVEGGTELDGGTPGPSDTAYAIIGTVGRRLETNFSVEAEIGYRSIEQSLSAFGYAGYLDEVSVMLNGVYDVPLTEQISLELGAGLGIEHVQEKLKWIGAGPMPLIPTSVVDDTQFAAQLKVGLSLALSDATEVVADYRYVNAYDNTLPGMEDNTMTVGLRFAL